MRTRAAVKRGYPCLDLGETALPCLLVKKAVRTREPSLQPSRSSDDAGNMAAIDSNRHLQRRDSSSSNSNR